MANGFLRRPLIIVAGGGWAETFNFWTGPEDARIAADLSAYAGRATLTQANVAGATPLVLTTDDESIVISGNAVTLAIARSVTMALAVGDYDFNLRLFDPAGQIDALTLLSNPAASRVKVIAGQPS